MIKRPFFALTRPRLEYSLLEPEPREPEIIPVPPILTVLVNESSEGAGKLQLKTKKKVEKGEKLLLRENSTEYAVSPVSGTIKAIESYAGPSGDLFTYIAIEAGEGADPAAPEGSTWDLEETLASADAHLRTLPGGLPLKQMAGRRAVIQTLVINAVDTDLCATTRQYVTRVSFDEIKTGALLLQKITGASRICLAVPKDLVLPGDTGPLEVIRVSATYPSGLPEMILADHLKTPAPAGRPPEDRGVWFISPEAVVSMARAYSTRKPVFHKILTVTGKGGRAYRVAAVIGTPLQKIFKALRIEIRDQDRIIVGGPMTGFSTYTIHHPVQPDMDSVIVQGRNHIPELSDTPCINCGNCVRICPARVPVNILVRYLENRRYEEAADFHDLLSCIGCGLCAYVCTARIPIFQYIRLGRYELSKLHSDD